MTKGKKRPTIKDLTAMPFFGSLPLISPDSSKVVYLKGQPNLKTNALDIEGFVYDVESKETHRFFKGGWNVKWADSRSVCCLKTVQPSGNAQIHVYHNLVGEPSQITDHPFPVQIFEPYGDGFVFKASKDSHKQRIGNFNYVENEVPNDGLFYIDSKRAIQNQESSSLNFEKERVELPPASFEITSILDEPLAIDSFVLSPKKNTIYLNCQSRSEMFFENETSCFKIQFDANSILKSLDSSTITEALSEAKLVRLSLPKGYKVRAVSPDGEKVLLTGRDVDLIPETRPDLWIVDESLMETPDVEDHLICLTEKIDRFPLDVHWTKHGIYVLHWEESRCLISRIDEQGEFETYSLGDVHPKNFFSMNMEGDIAFKGLSKNELDEIYLGKFNDTGWNVTKLTSATDQYSHLDFGTVESIKWISKDGTEIEGILRKPSEFDPKKKYPLIVHPHGGPRASSHLSLLDNEYYRPVHSFLAKGILILQPNYRGGLGKGREFMELNHNNMGVGDMWDIESGIDHLVSLGYIDETKIGSMGGSQGGYLSAFGGMHTDRFAAVNVMAGVSSWYIYYIGSDNRHSIHLTGTPHESENWEFYKKSAPIAAIDRAKTPMLIQHGENDERISVISAQEMYRALKQKGVPTELFTFPGKGHGFIAAQDNYAIMLQVYRWFCHYLLGEELDLFKDDF
ncbi:MAG: prolyl oligopeptidase family serine peptidase [Candidatus Thorarchaeota archaeon]